MTFHRRMIVVGLLVSASGSALANGASRSQDLGELQRLGQEGRGTPQHGASAAPAAQASSSGGTGLGELQQRGQEGRGEFRSSFRAEGAVEPYLDAGELQRRAQEGRGEPGTASGTRGGVARRD